MDSLMCQKLYFGQTLGIENELILFNEYNMG